MKKLLLPLALCLLAGATAHADQLGDALQLHAQHQYAKALPLLTRLAEAGNVQAQEQLAEMYWYGDGMPVDLARAEAWFSKAAAGGDDKAKAALGVMKARVERRQDIAYYTTRFDGGPLQFSQSGCVRPVVPGVSTSNEDIQRVSADIQRWNACYQAYRSKMSASLPALKLVPKDILDIMSDDDVAQAQALMERTLGDIAKDVGAQAAQVNQQVAAWHAATEKYVADANKHKGMSTAEWEAMERARANQSATYSDAYGARQAGAARPGGGK